jgi:protein MpaA
VIVSGKPPGSLENEAPPYADLEREWHVLAARDGLSLATVRCADCERSLLLADIAAPEKPVVAIAAGVHGDEPAASWALLSIVRDGLLDPSFAYRIWPCTNPSGYALGTRANAEGFDVNRSFGGDGTTPEARAIVAANRGCRFALTIDLHEDYEAHGFYCYEPLIGGEAPLGRAVVDAVAGAAFPIQELDDAFELGYPVEAHHVRRLEHGRVLPTPDAEIAFSAALPYSMYLLKNRLAKRSLTLESPRRLAWDDRIAIHRVAVVNALVQLSDMM